MSVRITRLVAGVAIVAFGILASCTTPEPRPEGVGRGITFSVTPLYPHSFEITAGGSRLRDAEELKVAWEKKARLVANGRHFKSSVLVVHNNESDYGGGPLLSRSVTGTITLTD